MKIIIILIAFFLTTNALSKTFETNFSFKDGKHIQYCVKTGNDGSDNKTGNDGSDNKTGNDGSDGKTICQIISFEEEKESFFNGQFDLY